MRSDALKPAAIAFHPTFAQSREPCSNRELIRSHHVTKPAEATFHIVFVNLLSNKSANGYSSYLSSRSTTTNAAVLTSSVPQLGRTHGSYQDFYFSLNRSAPVFTSQSKPGVPSS